MCLAEIKTAIKNRQYSDLLKITANIFPTHKDKLHFIYPCLIITILMIYLLNNNDSNFPNYQDILLTISVLFLWIQVFLIPYVDKKKIPEVSFRNIPYPGKNYAYNITVKNDTTFEILLNSVEMCFNDNRNFCFTMLLKHANGKDHRINLPVPIRQASVHNFMILFENENCLPESTKSTLSIGFITPTHKKELRKYIQMHGNRGIL